VRSNAVAWIVDVLTILIFGASTLVAVAVAYSLSRTPHAGPKPIETGGESIGGGTSNSAFRCRDTTS